MCLAKHRVKWKLYPNHDTTSAKSLHTALNRIFCNVRNVEPIHIRMLRAENSQYLLNLKYLLW